MWTQIFHSLFLLQMTLKIILTNVFWSSPVVEPQSPSRWISADVTKQNKWKIPINLVRNEREINLSQWSTSFGFFFYPSPAAGLDSGCVGYVHSRYLISNDCPIKRVDRFSLEGSVNYINRDRHFFVIPKFLNFSNVQEELTCAFCTASQLNAIGF